MKFLKSNNATETFLDQLVAFFQGANMYQARMSDALLSTSPTAVTYTSFTTGSGTKNITSTVTLPPLAKVKSVNIALQTAFAGAAATNFTIDVGKTSDDDFFIDAQANTVGMISNYNSNGGTVGTVNAVGGQVDTADNYIILKVSKASDTDTSVTAGSLKWWVDYYF